MTNIAKGLLAGFAATIVLSLLMLMKGAMGLMPALDPIGMIAMMMGVSTAIGWAIHFMIGTVIWGGGFAVLEPRLPGKEMWLRGVVFAIGAWLIMMVAMMPMAGAGLFGMQLGMMAPVMTLVMHIVFGAVLGWVYGMLLGRGTAHP
ncbi:hypothetical protein ACSSV4_001230 [Roseovarius sp. MBR-154]